MNKTETFVLTCAINDDNIKCALSACNKDKVSGSNTISSTPNEIYNDISNSKNKLMNDKLVTNNIEKVYISNTKQSVDNKNILVGKSRINIEERNRQLDYSVINYTGSIIYYICGLPIVRCEEFGTKENEKLPKHL